jgi:uncharacterized membrane protein
MFGLTEFGVVHTAISLVAVTAGAIELIRSKEISVGKRMGKVYLWATIFTCLTGFGIFQRGGFGIPHALGILTLTILGLAILSRSTPVFGRASKYIETVGLSTTFFFHLIPGVTETFTRLPIDAPMFSGPDDPQLKKVIAIIFAIFLVGVTSQFWRIRKQVSPSEYRQQFG